MQACVAFVLSNNPARQERAISESAVGTLCREQGMGGALMGLSPSRHCDCDRALTFLALMSAPLLNASFATLTSKHARSRSAGSKLSSNSPRRTECASNRPFVAVLRRHDQDCVAKLISHAHRDTLFQQLLQLLDPPMPRIAAGSSSAHHDTRRPDQSRHAHDAASTAARGVR